jgi:hypothetical protein
LPQPVFLMVSMMMSKRYLKGGLSSSFSVIFGRSISPENISLVGFQKSPISISNNYKLYALIQNTTIEMQLHSDTHPTELQLYPPNRVAATPTQSHPVR